MTTHIALLRAVDLAGRNWNTVRKLAELAGAG